jgi:hypothetical protein
MNGLAGGGAELRMGPWMDDARTEVASDMQR